MVTISFIGCGRGAGAATKATLASSRPISIASCLGHASSLKRGDTLTADSTGRTVYEFLSKKHSSQGCAPTTSPPPARTTMLRDAILTHGAGAASKATLASSRPISIASCLGHASSLNRGDTLTAESTGRTVYAVLSKNHSFQGCAPTTSPPPARSAMLRHASLTRGADSASKPTQVKQR